MAVLSNAVAGTTTLAILGWNTVGLHAAARNTARFSSLWCAAALASPVLVRIWRSFRESQVIYAFTAAHTVHFASVAALLLTFERSHIAQHPAQGAIVILAGSSVVVGLALTATATRPVLMLVRSAILYAVSSIFVLAFFRNAFKPLRGIAVLLMIAVLLRLAGSSFWVARQKTT